MIVKVEVEIDCEKVIDNAIEREVRGLAGDKQDNNAIQFAIECMKRLSPDYISDWEQYITNEGEWDRDIMESIKEAVKEAVQNGAELDNIEIY